MAKRKAAIWPTKHKKIIGCDVTIQFKNDGDHDQFFKNVLPVLLETDLAWELRMVQDIRIFAINVRSNANKKQWQEVLEPLLSKTSLSWKVIPATELTEEVQQVVEQLIDDGMLERIGLGADGQPVYQWTDLFKRLKVRPDVPETEH